MVIYDIIWHITVIQQMSYSKLLEEKPNKQTYQLMQ